MSQIVIGRGHIIESQLASTRKLNQALKHYNGHKGNETIKHIEDNISSVWEMAIHELTGRQYGLLMSVANKSYHDGKANLEKEQSSDGAIWINNVGLVEMSDIKRLRRVEKSHTITNIPLDQSDRWSGGHGKWIEGKYYQLFNIRHTDGTERNAYTSLQNYKDGDLIADGKTIWTETILDDAPKDNSYHNGVCE